MNTHRNYRYLLGGVALFAGMIVASLAFADRPVELRVQHFTVPPATGPVVHVLVTNLRDTPYTGAVSLELPDGWAWRPEGQAVALAGHETLRVPFTVDKAINLSANAYPVQASAVGAGETVVRRQSVVCASAPYGRPVIDGSLDEWEDSLPVAFEKHGKNTVMRTLWNRRTFYLAVEVEGVAHTDRDAIQFSLAAFGTVTGTDPTQNATRYEFLITSDGTCRLLITPEKTLSVAAQRRPRDTLEPVEAEVAVVHEAGTTRYECALPFSLMPDIRPSEGREFYFSLLVHDPDGTGLRDWGETAGLSPAQRNPLAWCLWDYANWGDEAPYDNKIEWGLCSSIH